MNAPEKLRLPTIFDLDSPGRPEPGYVDVFDFDAELPPEYRRTEPPQLPEVSEAQVVRHYTRLSERTFSVDHGFYPLGSCTMKYNPKVNEVVAYDPGFRLLHPYQPDVDLRGAFELMAQLERWLSELSGMHGATLTPSAGAQGELMGLLVARAYHESRGEIRSKVLIPDSAHGTNPASVTLAGFQAVKIASRPDGKFDLRQVEAALDDQVAAIMVTNPNTHGLFESYIDDVVSMVHGTGVQVYCDGANMNALLGTVRFGDLGFDLCHINLHKTFSTPHGGGGPGAGALCVKEHLLPFLPSSQTGQDADSRSIGRMGAFHGNFLNLVRAYVYMRALGRDGLSRVGRTAVINANYLLAKLSPLMDAPFGDRCMHEFIVSAKSLKKETGVRALDIAKRLLDYGYHAPTMYFPLTVEEDLLIEPTETETLETLDAFASAMEQILEEARREPGLVTGAPFSTPITRLDEAEAARRPVLRWHPSSEQ